MNSVTIHEMESVAQGLGAVDVTLDSGLGNVIDFTDSNDTLGLGMLANPGRARPQVSSYTIPTSQASQPVNVSFAQPPSGLSDIGLTEINTLEPVTLNLGSGPAYAPVEIEFKKA
jgi:hypothetical protein